MRVALFTYYDKKFQSLADVTLPVMKSYCAYRGYSLIAGTEDEFSKEKKFQYTKTKATAKMLNTFDFVMAMDIDTLITNKEIKVEDFADNKHDIYLTKDINNINLGVFIVKSTLFSKGVLGFVNAMEGVYIDEQNVFERNFFDRTKICKHPCFNSIPYKYYAPSFGYIEWDKMSNPPSKPIHEQGCWEPGDFIMHLPGMPNERRIEIFKETIKTIQL